MQMRSEDKKTEDILFYEKKAAARDRLTEFQKKLRCARLVTVIGTLAASAASASPFLAAYDSENTKGMIMIIAAVAVFAVILYMVSGAILCRSLPRFFKWRGLRSRFVSIEEDMKKLEEKFLDNTAFEPEVDATEERLLKISEEILDFDK